MEPRNVAAMIHRHKTLQIQPVWLNGITFQCIRRGGNLPPATLRIQPVWLNRTAPRHVIPTEMKWSGGIYPSSKLYLASVIFATWEDSSTRIRSLGMTYRGVVSFCPHGLYLQRSGRLVAAPTGVVPFNRTGYMRNVSRNGTQAVPYGFAGRWILSTTQVIYET